MGTSRSPLRRRSTPHLGTLGAKLADDITETGSDKDRESRGQGIANVITGFFGGMAGCAMIGQTMINVRTSGARTRLDLLRRSLRSFSPVIEISTPCRRE